MDPDDSTAIVPSALSVSPKPQLALGRYSLGARLGAGSVGSVFQATDTTSGNPVVVKFFDGQEDGFSPWASEMRLVLRFKHPNIVPCLDTGFDDAYKLWVLVFEHAKGGSLRRLLAAGKQLTALQIARILCDTASALAYAHSQGVVHRDVKPENIVAQREGEDSPWLLTDFGSGRFLAHGEVTRSLAGSLEYMAPEILTTGATAAVDQFSLGVMGLELWLGRLPPHRERAEQVALLRGSSGLIGVIARLAAADPEHRFLSMGEVAAVLSQTLERMKNGEDLVEVLLPYLRNLPGLPEHGVLPLLAEWDGRGGFLDFLVQRGLIERGAARTIEAIRKGYLDMPLASVFAKAGGGRATPGEAAAAPRAAAVAAVSELAAAPAVAAVSELAAAPLVAPEQGFAAERQAAASFSVPAIAEAADAVVVGSLPVGLRRLQATPPRSEPSEAALSADAGRSSRLRLTRPRVGYRLGRYTLQEQLGEGATATIFRAFHEMLHISVAIKSFDRIDQSSDPNGVQRFLAEAQLLVRLDHPHIVRVLDVDVFEQFPFIVMEYVGEMSLESQLSTLGQLPASRIARIGLAVADALAAATHEGFLHRDVKPANILERRDGHVKLADFGIATYRSAKGQLADESAAHGLIMGTPSYISPEQVMQPDAIDFRSDMYSLGATLYHAATGRPPLDRATVDATLMAHVNEEPPAIQQLVPGFDPQLGQVIHRMLRKRPAERYPSWDALRTELRRIVDDDSILEISLVEPGRPAVADPSRTLDLPVLPPVSAASMPLLEQQVMAPPVARVAPQAPVEKALPAPSPGPRALVAASANRLRVLLRDSLGWQEKTAVGLLIFFLLVLSLIILQGGR